MIVVAYVTVISLALIGVYAVCRKIDHRFEMEEIAAENVYKAGLIEQAAEEIDWLTDDMLKKVNDASQQMYKNFFNMGEEKES